MEKERLTALWFMAIISFRAIAAMHVLSVGYEEQAIGFARLVDELFKRAQKVREDESGEYARQWLKGRGPGTPTKLVGQEFYELLSGPVHAAARGVRDWIAVSREDGSTGVVVGPERRPESANATLSYMAGEGRDIAAMLAAEAGFEIVDLRDLDRQIHELQDRYLADGDGCDADRSPRGPGRDPSLPVRTFQRTAAVIAAVRGVSTTRVGLYRRSWRSGGIALFSPPVSPPLFS